MTQQTHQDQDLEQTSPLYTDKNIGSDFGRGEDGKYLCDQCDSIFTTQGNLNKHKKSKHEGIRYNCDQCDYKFT